MKEKLLEIISFYGVIHQLKYFQSEVWELNEAIFQYEEQKRVCEEFCSRLHCDKEKEHIAEEIADNFVMLYQFPEYYYQRLECHNIEPYNFKTDNYENIDKLISVGAVVQLNAHALSGLFVRKPIKKWLLPADSDPPHWDQIGAG